ncbi:hypothetical protein EVG20_g2999 [Dentipellis fragilis]|uniref:Uncharacterized protein n=1 Tax=Dentipellis fragilis TaxID=205917 RepID=A0A4Y9Z4N3_9AGAM|nr:hypothetical protein EVG20_g2999 [Dentipellis fragilis]
MSTSQLPVEPLPQPLTPHIQDTFDAYSYRRVLHSEAPGIRRHQSASAYSSATASAVLRSSTPPPATTFLLSLTMPLPVFKTAVANAGRRAALRPSVGVAAFRSLHTTLPARAPAPEPLPSSTTSATHPITEIATIVYVV